MNNRIQELAEQAWNTTAVSPDFGHPVSFAEKFAELIVQECIDYCGENLSKTVGGALKIHFGLELNDEKTI